MSATPKRRRKAQARPMDVRDKEMRAMVACERAIRANGLYTEQVERIALYLSMRYGRSVNGPNGYRVTEKT